MTDGLLPYFPLDQRIVVDFFVVCTIHGLDVWRYSWLLSVYVNGFRLRTADVFRDSWRDGRFPPPTFTHPTLHTLTHAHARLLLRGSVGWTLFFLLFHCTPAVFAHNICIAHLIMLRWNGGRISQKEKQRLRWTLPPARTTHIPHTFAPRCAGGARMRPTNGKTAYNV